MNRQQLAVLSLVSVLSTSFFVGCFGDDSVSSGDMTTSQTRTAAANDSLNQVMAHMMSDNYEYGNEDLSTLTQAHATYESALSSHPGNTSALFGSALTEVLLAAQNPRLSDLLNRTVEAPSPFDPDLAQTSSATRVLLMKKAATLAETFPEFHEVQDALADEMLPALEKAIEKIDRVYNDPAFSIKLTVDGETREIGHGEVGLLLGGLKGLTGLLTLFLSYDFDFDQNGSYAYIDDLESIGSIENFDVLTTAQSAALKHVTELLAPNSTFYAVRPTWQARLNQVEGHFEDAANIAKASLQYISTKNDLQGDDLISVCKPIVIDWNVMDTVDSWETNQGYCIDADEIDEAIGVIDSVLKYMKQPYALHLPDIDTTIRINFTAYYKVQDYKKLLPHYAFYAQSEWSREKPVFYFTNAAGQNTGTIQDLADLSESFDMDEITAAEFVDGLSAIIHFQDPTFQGFLPGATQASVWNLIRKQAIYEEQRNVDPLFKEDFNVMQPQFILKAATR